MGVSCRPVRVDHVLGGNLRFLQQGSRSYFFANDVGSRALLIDVLTVVLCCETTKLVSVRTIDA